MKSKILISILILVALVAGFFTGQWQTKRAIDIYWAKLMGPEVRRATADFSRAAGLIQQILLAGAYDPALRWVEDCPAE